MDTVGGERWRRIKEIFAEVVEQERSAREAALSELAARDPEAAAAARSLLRHYDQAPSGFLERSPLAAAESEPLPDLEGRTIGDYLLGAPLGSGGMGMVYSAVRGEDGKRVAVKLLRRRGDPLEVAAQVRAERRILAGLEHDNIARLIDGGATEEGLPYFTLEFVDGQPIDAYCTERGLDLPARLRLFSSVCAAAEYAHRRLVIHCDIKPANILVTAEGIPKLLDFGIARLLQPGERLESDGSPKSSLALTPEYASPEQVRGEPLTTATDVYALGLLLFELSTGRRAQPLPTLALAEIEQVVCRDPPPRPSAVAPAAWRRRLSGDLDAIVAKALRKEPADRYGSARELAEEVGRHLRGLPVLARGGGAGYRAGLFLRRHRAAFAAGALVAASLLAGIGAALVEGRRAQRRFEEVRQLAGGFLFEVHDAIRDLPGATPARRLVVEKALEYLDRLAGEAAGDLALLGELANAYQRVGDVQGYPANPNLGDTAGAAASYRKAVVLGERLLAAAPADPPARLGLACALERLGTTQRALGEGKDARASLDRAQVLLEDLRQASPRDGAVVHALHVVHLRQGLLSEDQGEVEAALAAYRAAEQVNRDLLAALPEDPRALRDLSVAASLIARIEGARNPQLGLELYLALLPPAEKLAASDPTNANLQRDLLVGHEDVAQMYAELKRFEKALAHHHQALAIAETLLAADPANEQALQDLSVRHAQIGDVFLAMENLPRALESYRRSLEIDAQVAARAPDNALAAEYLGWSHLNVAGVLAKQADHRAAIGHFRQAIEAARPFFERDPKNVDLRSLLADAHAGRGEALLAGLGPAAACPPEARAALEGALELWGGLELEPGPDLDHRDRVAARVAACGAAAG
jgi:tetratricopeptide (TPR) repeat protein